MHAHDRLTRLVDEIVDFLVGRQDVRHVARLQIQRHRLAEFGVAVARAVVQTFVANRVQPVAVHAFHHPIPGVVVYSARSARRPDGDHDVEAVSGAAMQPVDGEVLVIRGDPARGRPRIFVRQALRCQEPFQERLGRRDDLGVLLFLRDNRIDVSGQLFERVRIRFLIGDVSHKNPSFGCLVADSSGKKQEVERHISV